MGACQFSRVGYGKNDDQAYDSALAAATAECGHRDGYSGDLNSKDGYTLVTPPAGVLPRDWVQFIMADELPPSLAKHQAEFDRQFAIYDDKNDAALCIKLNDEKYLFFGYAPE